jgi:hypothetical protein
MVRHARSLQGTHDAVRFRGRWMVEDALCHPGSQITESLELGYLIEELTGSGYRL